MLQWIRNWYCVHRNRLMSRCRVCNQSWDVISYDPRGLWAYPWRKTVCPDHCREHEFNHWRDGFYCDHCGALPPLDYYDQKYED